MFKGEGELSLQHASGHNAGFSFVMAQKAGLQLAQKQLLLESQSENERLILLYRHMQELMPVLAEAQSQEIVVRLDGYLQARESF